MKTQEKTEDYFKRVYLHNWQKAAAAYYLSLLAPEDQQEVIEQVRA